MEAPCTVAWGEVCLFCLGALVILGLDLRISANMNGALRC